MNMQSCHNIPLLQTFLVSLFGMQYELPKADSVSVQQQEYLLHVSRESHKISFTGQVGRFRDVLDVTNVHGIIKIWFQWMAAP
jgi:hypothetical protein